MKIPKEIKAKYNKKYRNKTLEQEKSNKLSKRYGITLNDYNNMLIKQNYKCAICLEELKQGRSTHVDHCHSTNVVRGLLCHRCNLALGLLKDNKESILRILDYIL